MREECILVLAYGLTETSRDQKRKAKLKKRAGRSPGHESLAYAGTKYKTDALAPFFLQTEIGILESYVMCDRELLDDVVEEAIERMVLQIRQGSLASPSETGEVTLIKGEEEDFIIATIL